MGEVVYGKQDRTWTRYCVNDKVAGLTVLKVDSPATQPTVQTTRYLVRNDATLKLRWMKHDNLRDRELRLERADAERKAREDGFTPESMPPQWEPPKLALRPEEKQRQQTKREPGVCYDGLTCPLGCGPYVCKRRIMSRYRREERK